MLKKEKQNISLKDSIQLSNGAKGFNEGNTLFCLLEHLPDEAQWTDGFGGSKWGTYSCLMLQIQCVWVCVCEEGVLHKGKLPLLRLYCSLWEDSYRIS